MTIRGFGLADVKQRLRSCSCQSETEFWWAVSDENKASVTILYEIMIQEDKLMNLLEIKNLSKSFQKKKRVRSILNGLNVNFRGGEVAAKWLIWYTG